MTGPVWLEGFQCQLLAWSHHSHSWWITSQPSLYPVWATPRRTGTRSNRAKADSSTEQALRSVRNLCSTCAGQQGPQPLGSWGSLQHWLCFEFLVQPHVRVWRTAVRYKTFNRWFAIFYFIQGNESGSFWCLTQADAMHALAEWSLRSFPGWY